MHIVAQDSGLHRRGDFGCAGCLGSVADDAAGGGDGVGNGVGDAVQIGAHEVGDARSRTGSRTDRATEGGQPADAGLLVDGGEVRQSQSAVQLFVADLQLLGVLNDGQGSGHALIAGAGIDDHGHFTAVHTGVRACRCHGLGPNHHVVIAVGAKQDAADVGAVVAPQTFLSNGAVVLNLPVQHGLDIRDIHGFRKIQNIRKIQAGAVRQTGLALAFHGVVQQDLTVSFDVDDVGVVVDNAYTGGILAVVHGYQNLEGQAVVHVLHRDGGLFQVGAHLLSLLLGDAGDDLQLPGGITCHNACNRRGGNALHVVGVGHDNALDVLDDAAAGADGHPVGKCPQNLSGFGGAVGKRDGFRAAHGGDKLFFQNLNVGTVIGMILCHLMFSSFL